MVSLIAGAAMLAWWEGAACRGNGGIPKTMGPAGGGGVGGGGDAIGVGGAGASHPAWRALSPDGQPPAAVESAAAWTGQELVVWGGAGSCTTSGVCGAGARYRPDTDRWVSMSSEGAPAPRALAAATWTGAVLAIWGGRGCGGGNNGCGDGGLYDPATDRWTPMEAAGAPAARGWATAVWTGSEIIVWGGQAKVGGALAGNGGAYDPALRKWTALPADKSAPSARRYHSAVWTGTEMIVWGGNTDPTSNTPAPDGAAYDPAARRWRPLASAGAPSARWAHTAVWTGREMMIWGGVVCGGSTAPGALARCGDGALYDPTADSWRALPAAQAPTARSGHGLVWTGREAWIWGGGGDRCTAGAGGLCADGARCDPAGGQWAALLPAAAADARAGHVMAWTGSELLVWGGTGPGEGELPRFDGARLGQ